MRPLIWREVDDMTVVSLLGGLTHATAHNPSAVAWRCAEFYGTELYQITAPAYVPDPELARALWILGNLDQPYQRARAIDIALLSVGDISAQASIFRRGILNWSDAKSLRDSGAVGDVLCHFVDADGNVLDHPVNHRAMAISPVHIRDVPKVIISSGGLRKVHAIRAGIAATNAKFLITDAVTANAILELPALHSNNNR